MDTLVAIFFFLKGSDEVVIICLVFWKESEFNGTWVLKDYMNYWIVIYNRKEIGWPHVQTQYKSMGLALNW